MRRIVVALAGLLVVTACCYPPYQVEVFYPADGTVTEKRVYAPLWSPPSGGEGEYRNVEGAKVEARRLGIQIVMIVAAGAVVGALVPKTHRDSNAS